MVVNYGRRETWPESGLVAMIEHSLPCTSVHLHALKERTDIGRRQRFVPVPDRWSLAGRSARAHVLDGYLVRSVFRLVLNGEIAAVSVPCRAAVRRGRLAREPGEGAGVLPRVYAVAGRAGGSPASEGCPRAGSWSSPGLRCVGAGRRSAGNWIAARRRTRWCTGPTGPAARCRG